MAVTQAALLREMNASLKCHSSWVRSELCRGDTEGTDRERGEWGKFCTHLLYSLSQALVASLLQVSQLCTFHKTAEVFTVSYP